MTWKTLLSRIGFGWSLKHVYYNFDWTTANAKDVKELLILNKNIARTLLKHKLISFKKSAYQDKTVMDIFKWVVKNIHYASDNKKFGVKEKWETVDIVLGHWYDLMPNGTYKFVAKDTYTQPEGHPKSVRIADCESMTMTIHALCTALGCNPLQFGTTAGYVWVPDSANNSTSIKDNSLWTKILNLFRFNTKGKGGHSWLEYLADETMDDMKWYIIDAAYDPRNTTPFNNRLTVDNDTRYIERWFKVSDFDID